MTRLLLALAVLVAATVPGVAQQKMNMPAKTMSDMDMHETKSNAPYRPGLGELMTAFVQPHHIKLGLAGAAQNWPLADYELDELRETFEDIGKLIIKHGNLEIAPAIASTVKPSMDAVDTAIKAKDQAAFAKAYADLTAACNACHQSADHAMIVIQVPAFTGSGFPDQDFNPQPPK
jgi:hypothetical protein